MNKNGFAKLGEWYKGNLHCHTTNSDGSLTPECVTELYRKNGYDFLAISDHDIYTDYREKLNKKDFIILPAIEASAVLFKEKGSLERLCVHHMHGILGTSEMRKKAGDMLFSHMEAYPPRIYYGSWDGAEVAQEMQDDLKKRGCITTYNHPVWSRVKENEFIDIEGITALEIYNYGTVNESGTGFDTIHWDVMLRNGKKVYGFASDDNHNDGIVEDSFGGFIMVKADRLDHDSIVQAIIDGSYYSSSGPYIYDWGIEEDKVYVECSPVSRVNFIAGNLINAGQTLISPENTMTKAEFHLKGDEDYVRIECIDEYGRTAWSNPIFLRG